MKKLLLVLVLGSPIVFSGCNSLRQDWSHLKSETFGITRIVILYSATGVELGRWETTSTIEDRGGSFRFLLDNGKAVSVSGSVLILEK